MRIFFTGLSDSLTLLAFRFSSAKPIVKLGGVMFLLFSMFSVWVSMQTPTFIRAVMTARLSDDPTAETAKQVREFLSTYFEVYITGDMDLFVSIAVALLLGSIIFVPFSGYVIHGVISHSEMVIIKPGDNYKIGDSVLFQVISSFTLIQIVGLTVAAQLLTFDSEYSSYAVIFVWGVWVVMTLLTSFFSWVVEYLTRRFGKIMRFMFLSVFFLAIALALLIDENHGATLFGASHVIFDFLNQLATGDLRLLGASLVVLAGLSVAAIYGLTFMASQALRIPEPLTISKTNEKQVSGGKGMTLRPTAMLGKLLFRYNTVTKPVITAVAFSVIVVLLLKGQNAINTTMIVLPLAVGVSFGANIYGLVSGSVNWLLSIENWRRKMVHAATTIIFLSVMAVYVIAYGIGLLMGAIKPSELIASAPSLISVVFATTILSIYLSSRNPLPFSGKARENLISSPTALMGYVFLFLIVSGTAGNIALYAPVEVAWIMTAVIAIISTGLYLLLHRKWMRTEVYTQKLLKETINAG